MSERVFRYGAETGHIAEGLPARAHGLFAPPDGCDRSGAAAGCFAAGPTWVVPTLVITD